ncbi:MAG: BACON domain-containing protein [Alistipes sp.]|nr:BACON domain-containing protein [Alistipes sp.]
MKRFMMIAAMLLSVFALSSCEEDQWGYDNRVVFSAAGGDEDVDGDDSIHTLSIGNKEGDEKQAVEVAGVMTVTYDWLTATAIKGDNEIHLIAQPNKTGEKRKLYVYGMIGNRVMDITVVQNK